MKHRCILIAFFIVLFFAMNCCMAYAGAFQFSDNRFCGLYTTENLDAIIDEYELYDGWYWTTKSRIIQTYHGFPESPGWTDAAEKLEKKGYLTGWYGCRWMKNEIPPYSPNKGGYGECFGFAQFIGYLLSGEWNPHGNWNFYYSIDAAGGLKPGDILRVEYSYHQKPIHHSAVVYAVNGEEILFMQVSGSNYNRISIGSGFTDGNLINCTDLELLKKLPGQKICRSPANCE